MSTRRFMTVLLAVLLFGCASHEGTYSPGCAAFAGDTITLSDGQFVWDKFTDSINLDDEGNVISQFPDYPMKGSYRIEGKLVIMETASGEVLADMYIQQYNGHHYLLTAGQFEARENTGEHNRCALVLGEQS